MPKGHISGRTRLFAVIGDPVTQVRAPQLLNDIFLESGLDAVAVPLNVRAEEFDRFLPSFLACPNVDGLLITIPHKFSVPKHVARMGKMVRKTRCANIMRRTADGWEAENFDGVGFVEGLLNQGHTVEGARVLLVGAGGAGAAIAAAIAEQRPMSLHIFDKSTERTKALLDQLDSASIDAYALKELPDQLEYDLAINATPLGLRKEDLLPFNPDTLSAEATVAEVIMEPYETALLSHAQQRGLRVHHGAHMLDAQIPFYRRFFGI